MELNELNRIDPKSVKSRENRKYWALYASFYEKLFQKIDDEDKLQLAYNIRVKNKDFTGEGRDALTFFYRVRRDELNDPNFWDKVKENKEENMKAKLVKESLNESVSRHCAFYKASDGQWYMELANGEYDEWDESTTYGPFSSEEKVEKYLHDNFSNPGGMHVDDSGEQEPPIESPNGRPVVRPSSGEKFNTMRSMGFR